MVRLACYLIISLVSIPFASAQFEMVPNELKDLSRFIRDQKIANKNYTGIQKTNVSGSPYLSDIFQKGVILMRDTTKYTGIPLRYQIYLDELEFKDEKDQVWALANPELVQFIELEKQRLVLETFIKKNKVKINKPEKLDKLVRYYNTLN